MFLTKEQAKWLGVRPQSVAFNSRAELDNYLAKHTHIASEVVAELTWNTCINVLSVRKLIIPLDFDENVA